MSNHDPKDMLLFAKVVESGSLSAASRLTQTPKATLSRAITRLESTLNVRLLERSARSMSVTDAGRILYEYCFKVGCAVDEAATAIGALQGKVHGTLKLGSSLTIGQTLLKALLPEFIARHPELRLRLELTNRNIDLVEEGFDVVLRAGPLTESSLVAKQLGVLRYSLLASPDYLARVPPITCPEDLQSMAIVANAMGKSFLDWELQHETKIVSVRLRPRLDFNDANMRREAVIKGAGIGLIPGWICREAVAAGALVQVLPQWTNTHCVSIYAIWPSRRYPTPRLRAFVDYMGEQLPRYISEDHPANTIGNPQTID